MTDGNFSDTLDELAAMRATAEEEYLSHARELEVRVARVLEATAAAESAARQANSVVVGDPPTMSIPLDLESSRPDLRQPDQAPWPVGGGLRALVNKLTRWWLRDYLAVLDARHEALAERSDHLEADLDNALKLVSSLARSNEALVDYQGRVASALAAQTSRAEALREALNRVGESIELMSGASLRCLNLMNAKDAEIVQRVMGGADQKAEAVLDVLARRQEALLAELVGRRQELDELVAAARASD